MSAWSALRSYSAADDPLAAATNTLALAVAGNQPFYPLYVYFLVSSDIGVTFFTFLSTPLFLAVPAANRRWPASGRALLPAAGLINTLMCVKLFGEASGVELFIVPCFLIALAQFPARQWKVTLALVGLAALMISLLHGHYGLPFHQYTADEYRAFFRLNAFSVAMLSALAALVLLRAHRACLRSTRLMV